MFTLNSAAADEECRSSGVDVCLEARRISSALAPMLPIQVNESMTWYSVAPAGRRIISNWRLSYDANHLRAFIAKMGVSDENVREVMSQNTVNGICSPGVSREFIDIGGEIEYVYFFNNGSRYDRFVVSDCQ